MHPQLPFGWVTRAHRSSAANTADCSAIRHGARSPRCAPMTLTRTLTLFAACAVLGLTGCGGGGDSGPPPSYTTQILSDPVYDGDIEQVSASSYTVTQGMSADVQSVLAGIDPVGGTEF